MTFPGGLPYSLSIPFFGSGGGLYTPVGYAYSYAIASMPWLSAASRENPIIRQTAPFRKQQFDNQSEPGEQSIDSGYWIRSQQSFHGGAGQLYGDPVAGDDSFSSSRFWQSKGVDPWTPGELSLLRLSEPLLSTGVTYLTSDGVRAVGILTDGDLVFIDDDGTVATDDLTGIADPPILGVTLDSTYYYVSTSEKVYKRLISDAPMSAWTEIYDLGATVMTSAVLGWVKERLVLATQTGIFELTDLTAPSAALPSAKWTPPQGTWTPTSIAESNSAIYVAGTITGERSVVLKFTLDNTGAMPTLASGVVVASLPQGEVINSIFGYLGRFMAISTSFGPRIAEIDENGDLTIGPNLFEGDTGSWAARGQYIYTSAAMPEFDSGEGGLCRVDLGLQHGELRFAYASDLYINDAGTGAVGCGAIMAGLVYGTDEGIYLESATDYIAEGWLQGPRIRYGTLEPKIYKLLRSRGPALESDYFVSVVDPDGNIHNVVGYVAGQTPGSSDATIPPLGPLDYLSVRITLSASVDGLSSAISGGYQLKALPGTPRQRIFQLPVWCFDFEKDRNGLVAGYEGYARERLLELESIDQAADTVSFQDLDAGEVYTANIESVEFRQMSPPDGSGHGSGQDGFGGTIILTLRTV